MSERRERSDQLNRKAFASGFVIPLVVQTIITCLLGWLGAGSGRDPSVLQLGSSAVTTAMGFAMLTRDFSTTEKVLVGCGYFPLMLIAFLGEALYVNWHMPGAQGNF